MESVLQFAKGPLFVFTFTFMVLGLARHVLLNAVQVFECVRRLSYRQFNVRENLKQLVSWLFPFNHIRRHRPFVSACSFLFHVGLLIVPLFLVEHIALWLGAISFGWPAIPLPLAELLTLTTIVTGVILLLVRVLDRNASALSEPIDYFLLLAILAPFVTGFMALHPWLNPLSYNAMMLIHVLSAELVFVLLPTTKLAHSVLFAFDRFSSEVFWKMPVGAGAKVARELRGEEARV